MQWVVTGQVVSLNRSQRVSPESSLNMHRPTLAVEPPLQPTPAQCTLLSPNHRIHELRPYLKVAGFGVCQTSVSDGGSPSAGCDKVVKGWLDKALVLLQYTSDVTPTMLHVPLDAPRQTHIIVCSTWAVRE
jgi:hypothetical protein